MSNVWFERESLKYFDEFYVYEGYALVNEIYEDEDHRANTWMWGKVDEDTVTEVRLLKGLSSNSYAPWAEVFEVFKNTINNLDKAKEV
jgi:hypothetical protein